MDTKWRAITITIEYDAPKTEEEILEDISERMANGDLSFEGEPV